MENVSWLESSYGLSTLGLTLPTEAQWEYAARADTETPWWTGSDPKSLEGAENLCDKSAFSIGEPGWNYEAWDDGFPAHAPINSFTSNPWGFHNILGNVGEWTSDRYLISAYEKDFEPGTGARQIADDDTSERTTRGSRAIRGPGWFRDSSGVRVSARYMAHESIYKTSSFGMRPARMLDS